MPKVSVIIPVYNEERYLAECLDSILQQTLTDLEVLCVDAGSTDSSPSILRSYSFQDHRIAVITGNQRLDAGSARNLGLDRASGEYLAFLDADDLFHPTMLEDAYQKAKKDNSDIVIYAAQQLDMKTGHTAQMPWSLEYRNCPKSSPFSPDQMSKHLFNSFQNWTWNKLFRHEFIKANRIRFQAVQRTNDMAFTCEALALAKGISVLPREYVSYRVGTGTSLQQTTDRSPTCFWDAYKETKNRLISAGVYETYRQSFLNAVLSGTVSNLRSVKSEDSIHAILHLIQTESDEFGIDQLPGSYFYNPSDYQTFRRCQSGQYQPDQRSHLGLLSCIADHGLIYTIKYAFRKLFLR